MNKNEWKKWVGVVGRILVAYAMVFAQGAWATQNQATKDKAGSPQKAAVQQANEKQSAVRAKAQSKQAQGEESESVREEKPSGGASQGIKVHGHWTIEVRNPDGTLATHREFENSLQSAGASFLAGCLVNGCGQTSWQIKLHASTAICSNPIFNNCIIPATAGLVGGTVVLTANLNSVGAGSIDFVTAEILSPSFALFSQAPTSVAVSAGQLVAATVNYSFS